MPWFFLVAETGERRRRASARLSLLAAAPGELLGAGQFRIRTCVVTALTDRSRAAPAPGSSRARAGAGRTAPPVPHLGESGTESCRRRRRFRERRSSSGCERAAPAGARPGLSALRRSERPTAVRPPPSSAWNGSVRGPARPLRGGGRHFVRRRIECGGGGAEGFSGRRSLPWLVSGTGWGPARFGCARCRGGKSRDRRSRAWAGRAGGEAEGGAVLTASGGSSWRSREFPPCSGTKSLLVPP